MSLGLPYILFTYFSTYYDFHNPTSDLWDFLTRFECWSNFAVEQGEFSQTNRSVVARIGPFVGLSTRMPPPVYPVIVIDTLVPLEQIV